MFSFFVKPLHLKNLLTCIILFSALPLSQPGQWTKGRDIPLTSSENLIIITLDGVRWQEIFNGADASLLGDPSFTPDTATMKMLYWAERLEERRKKLMPFTWSVIASKGRLYGNRDYRNHVNVANLYRFSYPGYNEIFTGQTDIEIRSNKKIRNENTNVLQFLDQKHAFKGKVVAFTSWDVFPYILNEEKTGVMVNSGYEQLDAEPGSIEDMINTVQDRVVAYKGETRYDQLTFLAAKEYLQQHRPRVVFIGLGQTDEHAHAGRYDLYLEQLNKADRMIAELWNWVQTTPGYKDNTSILITTDHGRGSRDSKWTSHSTFIRGSSQTWLALMGPGIEPLGEIKEEQQLYQQQLAGVIAGLVGEKFGE
jgi:hypothetical protein